MLKFLNKLNKRGIILASVLFFLSLVIVLIFFVRTDFSVKNFIDKNSQLLAQTILETKLETVPYFFPRFPQRLISHLSEMETITEELVEFNEKLNNQLRECNCRNALSQCLPRIAFGGAGCTPGRVLGQPCLEQGEIEIYKEEISDRIDNLSYLRELLIKEMEGGLEAELKTLRPEVAEELKNKLNEVLGKSEEILLTAKENRNLYSQDYTQKCIASCQAGLVRGIKGCLQLGSAPQRQIEIKAELGIGLDDLDLGEVGIDKFNLSLPDKLQFPKLGDITITIPSQGISVCFPFEPITISVEPPSPATLPTLSFGCPKLPKLPIPKLPKIEQDETVETGGGINWYFKILGWLMEGCSKLPTMSGQWGLKEKAADCYNPEKVISTIVKECDASWNNYCRPEDPGPEPPAICKKIRFSCKQNGKIAPALQCQNLFKQKGEAIPSSCIYETRTDPETGKIIYIFPLDFDPVGTLKNKCQELKDQGEKEIPEPCKILPLFTGKIEAPDSETYSPSEKTSLPAQKIFNVPFGFGSGLGFNCPLGLSNLPSLPKITLPDIIIPDIILPEFEISPFLEIKLPKIIFEDVILPDIELCDLNNCAYVFPSLNFQFPRLNLPSFDYSGSIPQVPGLNLRLGFDFPSINFSLPQLDLFNLLLPELKLPEIRLPSPDIDFNITGIDLGSIFELIFSFILNAMEMPDFGGCIETRLALPSLSIVFPDYYFSFLKFPKIPEIPFCEDIKQFCDKAKNALGTGGWLKKAKEIEREFNKTIGKIQKEIDKISEPINEGLKNQMDQVFREYGQIIYEGILKQVQEKGLSVEDYINPKTRQLELDKIPFPGVFPVREIDKKECLPLSLPETKIILRIVEKKNLPEKKVERKGRQIIVHLPLNVAPEIPIPWPEKLKEIKLTNPLTYEIPKIPLKGLGFKKEFAIKGPGFQPRTFSFDFGKTNEGDCLAKPPTGGNPFPIGQMTSKLNEIKNLQSEIKSNSQAIIKILE